MNKHSVQALKDLKTAHAAVTLLVNASPEVARIMEKTAHEAVRKAQEAYDKIVADINTTLDNNLNNNCLHSSA